MSLTASIITGGVNSHQTTAEEANSLATDIISAGVIGTLTNTNGAAPATGGFAVNAQGSPDATVAVSAGVCYVTATPTGGNSQKVRVKNSASANVTISANASGSTKYDWLYVKVDPDKAIAPNVSATDVATLTTSRSSSQTADNGTPSTYGTLIAIITVANGFSTITNGNITDSRAQASISSVATISSGWTSLGSTPASVTALGNRSYTCVFNSVDLTGTVSNGMRLLLQRTVAAPTKCTSLNGSTQYYSKSSPAGMTFTDDFVVSAWVKLSSYANSMLVSRSNSTSGWYLQINASGQVVLAGLNAGAANFSQVLSYQSLPLNKWVHVAAQLDMSTFTATTTTSYIMIDGVDVPSTVTRGGTNPTALVQAGNLEIGSWNGGLLPLPGKIAQVAIYSAKVTQATILASMNQTLSGSETSLISAYSFNNSINDLNANANNLTANGSAVATNADSPFAQAATAGSLEYGIITGATFSTNTTLTVQVPEGSAIPTSGGVSAVSYSSQGVPFGFPKQQMKWKIHAIYKASETISFGSTNVWYGSVGCKLTAPIGAWEIGYIGPLDLNSSAVGNRTGAFTMYDSTVPPTNAVYNGELTTRTALVVGQDALVTYFRNADVTLSTSTNYLLAGSIISATGSEFWLVNAGQGQFDMYAKCAYL